MSIRPSKPAPGTPAPGKLPLPELAQMKPSAVMITADVINVTTLPACWIPNP